MGNGYSEFSKEQLIEYQNCTFFTIKEILKIHKLYRGLLQKGEKTLSKLDFFELPFMRFNPLKNRIHKIFCSDEEHGRINFEDFLDMLSVFSPDATKEVKAYTAFKIYDLDDDGYIGKEDICEVIKLLTGDELLDNEVETIYVRIMEEVDIDGDGDFSYVEFEQIINRSPDFSNLFKIQIL